MCRRAALEAPLARVVYAARLPKALAVRSLYEWPRRGS